MNTKITLYAQDDLIAQVKSYAKENKTSVSKLVNNFFESLVQKKENISLQTKITDELHGVLQGMDLDEKSYKKHLEEKYL